MHGCWSKYLIVAMCLVAAQAQADGGISSLGGLLAAVLILIGVGGLVLVSLLIPAVWSATRNDHTSKWTIAALILGGLYVPFSLFFYVAAQQETLAKFPGFLAAVVLALVCAFLLRHYKWLRIAALASLGIVSAVLLVVPAQFWKGNAFDLVEVIFVDNSEGLQAMDWSDDRDSKRQLLHMSDGRDILQFQYNAETNAIGELFGELPGVLVKLQELDADRGGEWFEVTHYVVDSRHKPERQYAWMQPRHSLFTRTIALYRQRGQKSTGVLLDASAEIDFKGILLHMLARSGTHSLKSSLINVGRIDINEQSFIDEAFENSFGEAYRFLFAQGLDVNATNSNGESLLHRAAEVGDVWLMQVLKRNGGSLTAENAQGLTPLQVFFERHSHRPIVMRPFRAAFPEAVPP